MSKSDLYDFGFGTVWHDVFVDHRAGYTTSVTDHHVHQFYEINLILSGNIRILTADRAEEHRGNCMVLTHPGTPHYISCRPDTLYSRLYLVFTADFVENRLPEWHSLATMFGQRGTVLTLTPQQTEFFRQLIEQIEEESNSFRKLLLIYYLLSHLREQEGVQQAEADHVPSYVLETIAYLENHCDRDLLVDELARQLHIGRTTLMVGFKKHTGQTVGEYLTGCRLHRAVCLLESGRTLEYAAGRCGYADIGGLIRAFRRCYGMTPKEYMRRHRSE